MNKTLNKLTTIFFFLLFFVLAPLFVFYAEGYRFNTNTRSVEKNGAFYVKSYPNNAQIYINGQKTDKNTPTQLVDIKPDLHKIKVTKESYIDWEKELSVYPGQTTFAEDVVLFLQNRPKEILDNGSDNYLINRQKNKYAYIDEQNTLYITDTELSRTIKVIDLGIDLDFVEWSYNNENILLKNELDYYIFNINKKTLDKLNINIKEKIIWDNINSNILWYLDDGEIYKYNFNNQGNKIEPQEVKNETIINDFDLYENYLVIQYESNNDQFVDQIKKDDFSSTRKLANMIHGEIKILLANDDNLIFILGTNLYIKNENRDLISMPVTKAEIHDDRILITNGHEILLYNFKEDWQELIDRSSQIISEVMWHPNGSYFLSEIDGQTKITEIDGRDKRNSINIYKDYLKKIYLFNNKGDKLFILTPEENFYLTIQ